MTASLPEIVEGVSEREIQPTHAALECLRILYDLPQDDLAATTLAVAAQTFATLAIADALVSVGGVTVGDALPPVPR